MARRYKQGKFTPQNPEKYVGDLNKIVWRSSWEKEFLRYCDLNPSVIQYSSEELAIPYVNPIDNTAHRYFPDVVLTIKNKKGELVKMMVEIKPSAECSAPTSKNKRVLMEQTVTFIINQAKWSAARAFCTKHNMQFQILTERELFKNGR